MSKPKLTLQNAHYHLFLSGYEYTVRWWYDASPMRVTIDKGFYRIAEMDIPNGKTILSNKQNAFLILRKVLKGATYDEILRICKNQNKKPAL